MKKLSIVFIAAEVAPYAKAGGVADVVRSLPKALHTMGHNVSIVVPLHGSIDRDERGLEKVAENVPIHMDDTTVRHADFWKAELAPGLPVYFIDNKKYFSSHKTIYGTSYQNTRYYFFDLAVFKLLNVLEMKPDLLHCHDWQAGLVPYFLKSRFLDNPLFSTTRSLYTIHNLTFQFGTDWWTVAAKHKDFGRTPLPSFEDKKHIERINFAKRAIISADLINTVSETYAHEILTKEFGQDLHRILKSRYKRLYGIVNGIDYFDYNPKTDPGITRQFDVHSLHLKAKNKSALQARFNLPKERNVPIIGMVARLTEQKGLDLLVEAIDPLMRMDVQCIIHGIGSKNYEQFFRKTAKRHPKKFAYHPHFDAEGSTQVYAGTDMYLMPSRFEPCGLGQLIGLRYGSVPIVRATGGLTDTVTDYDLGTGRGNGFVFKTYDSRDMLVAIARAIEVFKDEGRWGLLVQHGMTQSFSWEIPAQKYVTLYRKALKLPRNP